MALIALYTSSTGLNAQATALDVIANNLANVNTEGFKSSRTLFQDLMYMERAQPGTENANGDQRPIGLYVGLGVKVAGTQLDFRTGSAIPTDRALDIMIEGNGFFQVEINDEVGEGIGYTRAGSFSLNSEGEFVLVTDQGRRLIPTITVPEGASNPTISEDGIVSVMEPGQIEPSEIGQIEIATFINPQGLRQLGENLFLPSIASGDPSEGEPLEGGRGALRQGFVEGSNVNAVTELVNLIRTQRAFEMNSQVTQAADEVMQTVANLRRF